MTAAKAADAGGRPTLSRSNLADRLALLALPFAAITAAAGLLVVGVYRDTDEGIRQAQATDLATLVLAVPALAVGLWRARRGSAGGRFVAVAALGYLAYSYAILPRIATLRRNSQAGIALGA